MIVSDVLYGEFSVEDVLEKLITCPEVQRLKDVHMIGPSYLLNPLWNETRYEHSIGVMLLIRKLGGSLEEQIAGLLHDVSHTVFSHVIDLVMKKEQENYHEEIKQNYLKSSSIPAILQAFGYDYTSLLLDDTQWSILEQTAPLLCADRIDYTLREVLRYFDTTLTAIHDFLSNLKLADGQIVLKSIAAGEWFIDQYYKIVLDLFYDPTNMYGYHAMAAILDYALSRDYLTPAGLLVTETEVLTHLSGLNDPNLKALFDAFFASVTFQKVDSKQSYDLFQKKKMRLVDPIVTWQGQLVPTTACSASAKRANARAKKISEHGVYLLVISAV